MATKSRVLTSLFTKQDSLIFISMLQLFSPLFTILKERLHNSNQLKIRPFDWTTSLNLRWQWCWWQRYIDYLMMVNDLSCWWQNQYVGDFFRCITSVTRLHRCWWRMLETKCVGDKFKILVTDLIQWKNDQRKKSPTWWFCHQHLKSVTIIKSPT